MKLRGPRTSFELQLLGRPDHDGWCRVRIDVETPEGRWSKIQPCLEGAEVEWLAGWLEGSAAPRREPWCFTEPFLGFAFPDADRTRFRVYFALDFLLKWASPDSEEDFYVEFPLTEQVLQQAAHSLREQLKQGSKRRNA
jgi:hypothetical protein